MDDKMEGVATIKDEGCASGDANIRGCRMAYPAELRACER